MQRGEKTAAAADLQHVFRAQIERLQDAAVQLRRQA